MGRGEVMCFHEHLRGQSSSMRARSCQQVAGSPGFHKARSCFGLVWFGSIWILLKHRDACLLEHCLLRRGLSNAIVLLTAQKHFHATNEIKFSLHIKRGSGDSASGSLANRRQQSQT